MSGDKDYPNSGIMFRDDRKRIDRDRDYKGSADITCPDCGNRFQMWLSGWIKNGRRGKFLSLAFKPMEARPEPDLENAPPDDEDGLDF
jgi:hypothetical protein